MRINVDFDYSEVARWSEGFGSNVVDMAKASALNKIADKAKTRMVREIAAEFEVSSAYVRDRLQIKRASAAAQRFVMEVTLAAVAPGNRRAANLIRFAETSITLAQARKRMKAGEGGTQTLRSGGQVQKALQLRFKIKRSGGKKMIEGAFIANKGRTVFIREGSKRLPIKALQTIDIPQMFNTKRINAVVVEMVKAELPALLERELQYYLSRYG